MFFNFISKQAGIILYIDGIERCVRAEPQEKNDIQYKRDSTKMNLTVSSFDQQIGLTTKDGYHAKGDPSDVGRA